jgi:2-polyprenyl-3-methyl-5-hydroxy-6-metoxy-1,4-benzoquinol methylase
MLSSAYDRIKTALNQKSLLSPVSHLKEQANSHMDFSSIVRQDTPFGVLSDISSFILAECSDKSVLNIGAAGGVQNYLPNKKHIWLHYQISQVAAELVGIDIDKASIDYAAKYGISITEGNCECMQLGHRFDLVVMSDVIEHLNAPGLALQTLMNHLNLGGKILITTPNPTHYGLIARSLLGRSLNIYYDHVCCFFPEHIQALCIRFGYRLSAIYFFGNLDKRSLSTYIKSSVSRLFGRFNRRLFGWFLAIIEPV